ncbi:hypothetical protein HGM15179_019635, partial [Zosterops borbonicus]
PIPLESAAVLVDLSQPTLSLPRLVSVHSWEAVGQNCPPPAAGDAEVGIPPEVPQEEIAAEKPSMPKTSSEDLEENKGLEKEAVKDSGNPGQDLGADIPEEAGKEVTPAVCRTKEQADPSPGEPQKNSCVGRPGACQRNATREFYSCPICRKTFLLKINLLIHQRGHTNWVPYVCVHCNRKFMSKKKIRRHLRAWAANGTCQPSELEWCLPALRCEGMFQPGAMPNIPASNLGSQWNLPALEYEGLSKPGAMPNIPAPNLGTQWYLPALECEGRSQPGDTMPNIPTPKLDTQWNLPALRCEDVFQPGAMPNIPAPNLGTQWNLPALRCEGRFQPGDTVPNIPTPKLDTQWNLPALRCEDVFQPGAMPNIPAPNLGTQWNLPALRCEGRFQPGDTVPNIPAPKLDTQWYLPALECEGIS